MVVVDKNTFHASRSHAEKYTFGSFKTGNKLFHTMGLPVLIDVILCYWCRVDTSLTVSHVDIEFVCNAATGPSGACCAIFSAVLWWIRCGQIDSICRYRNHGCSQIWDQIH